MLKTFLIAFSLLILSGCLHWPPDGTGGVAELYYSPFMPYKIGPAEELTHEQMLEMRLLVARNYLDRLDIKGARACFPGLWYITNLQANRTTREFAGGLFIDGYHDLIILEDQINGLKRRLAYVQRNGACLASYKRPTKIKMRTKPHTKIYKK